MATSPCCRVEREVLTLKDLKHLIYFESLLDNADNELVEQAKKDGIIDQFIYGSISATYLADIVDSL